MIDDFARDIHRLQKADSLIAKIWFDVMARRFGFFVFAGLIAVFGLGMINVASFYALLDSAGPVWAAVIVAIADFVLAAIIILMVRNSEPGPEIEQALDIRKMAIDAVQADARDLKANIDALGQEIRGVKDAIAGFVHDPWDSATQKLLVPAALSIIKGLRSKKDQAEKEALH
jgi:hypothetical protein